MLRTVSKVEKIFGSYAFIEGWAHYCEKMLVDEGYGTVAKPTEADEKRAAKYATRPSRRSDVASMPALCRDQNAHPAMTVEEATKFFQDNCYYERNAAHGKRCAHYRPRLSNYTLGKLQILKLRDDYKAAGGVRISQPKISQRAAQPRHAPDSIAPRSDAEIQIEVGRSALIACHPPLTLAKAGRHGRRPAQGGSI